MLLQALITNQIQMIISLLILMIRIIDVGENTNIGMKYPIIAMSKSPPVVQEGLFIIQGGVYTLQEA